MATRRRGADLSDLKNRLNKLGGDDASEADEGADSAEAEGAGQESDGPRASETKSPAPGDAGAAPADGPPAPRSATPSAPSTSAYDDEDFSDAVSEVESNEPTPVDDEPIDDSFASSGGSYRMGLVIAVVLSALIALVFGYLTASLVEGRRLVNAQINEAGIALSEVSAAADTLIAANSELMGLPAGDDFNSDVQAILSESWQDGRAVLSAAVLNNTPRLMAYNRDISRDMTQMAYRSQVLNELVERHLRLTRRDQPEITAILEDAADETRYGFVFDIGAHIGAYNELLESDEEEPIFQPEQAVVVSYEELELDSSGDSFEFRVTFPDGRERSVPARDMVRIERDMLLDSPTTETAISRWQQRRAEIQEQLDELLTLQQRLRGNLEDLANRSQLTTI